jgi:hypothetical protein
VNRYIGRQLIKFRKIRGKLIPIVMSGIGSADKRIPGSVYNAFGSLQKSEAWTRSLVPKVKKVPLVGKSITSRLVKNVRKSRLRFMNSVTDVAANPKEGAVFSRYARMIMNATKKKGRP